MVTKRFHCKKDYGRSASIHFCSDGLILMTETIIKGQKLSIPVAMDFNTAVQMSKELKRLIAELKEQENGRG